MSIDYDGTLLGYNYELVEKMNQVRGLVVVTSSLLGYSSKYYIIDTI